MQKFYLTICLALLLLSCSKSDKIAYESAVSVTEIALPEEEVVVNSGEPTNDQIKDSEQKIIKHGTLKFESADMDATADKIYKAVNKYQAQIQNDTEEKNYDGLYRRITLRVTNNNFEHLVREVSSGVGYFDQKEISSEDVTERYIDLEARLKAKKELENRYLELLKKANKISEILEIEKEINNIREEIESHQGQLNYLQNRIAMSTLQIQFYKKTADSGITHSYGSKMWHSIKSGFGLISSFFLGVLYIWPFLLLFAAILYFALRKSRQKK